ncbi:CLUMA_CG019771, isoform A [Clunio marinus]|uniref:CLUMA_CG019771, isoform A n=1 Tax=Clunio marinus TaxID=568069 RepID=A0A1J1J4N5_9DIPT|nr:CLUMA_CG019771, isoform A [Clunio marinus]
MVSLEYSTESKAIDVDVAIDIIKVVNNFLSIPMARHYLAETSAKHSYYKISKDEYFKTHV